MLNANFKDFLYVMFEPVSSTPDSRRRAKKTPKQQVKPHHSALPQHISYYTKSPG